MELGWLAGEFKRLEALIALGTARALATISTLRNRVVSPNDFTTNTIGNLTPIGAPIVAVVDITPRSSGLLYVSGYFAADATSVGVDDVAIQANYLPGLTGITGGTLIAPGLTTAQGAAITGAASSGAPVQVLLNRVETPAPGGGLSGGWTIPVCFPLQAVARQRTGIAFLLISANGRTFTNLRLQIDVTDQP